MDIKEITLVAEKALEGTDMFVVDCTITPDNTIDLTLDSDTRVSIDACAMINHAIGDAFNRDEEDYSLTVASAGIGEPLKLVRQYKKLVGNSVEVLLKSGVKIADSVHGHGGTVKLIGAISGKHGDFAHGNNFHAVFRPEPQPQGIALEHDAAQCAFRVLHREIMMPGRIYLIVTDLSPDSYTCQQRIRLHNIADILIDLRNGKHLLCHIIPPGLCM